LTWWAQQSVRVVDLIARDETRPAMAPAFPWAAGGNPHHFAKGLKLLSQVLNRACQDQPACLQQQRQGQGNKP